jgi:hypothetical protein
MNFLCIALLGIKVEPDGRRCGRCVAACLLIEIHNKLNVGFVLLQLEQFAYPTTKGNEICAVNVTLIHAMIGEIPEEYEEESRACNDSA